MTQKGGAEGQTCTVDTRFFRAVLYYLSYLGRGFLFYHFVLDLQIRTRQGALRRTYSGVEPSQAAAPCR